MELGEQLPKTTTYHLTVCGASYRKGPRVRGLALEKSGGGSLKEIMPQLSQQPPRSIMHFTDCEAGREDGWEITLKLS